MESCAADIHKCTSSRVGAMAGPWLCWGCVNDQPCLRLLDKIREHLCSTLILAVVCVWGVRLTANWAYTFQNLNWQDWRYTMLKEKTGRAYPLINFLGIHLFPTIVVYLCVMPAVYLIESGAQINRFLVLGCVISLLGALTQAIADLQMHKYRKNRVGNFIRTGLWKHSRHPNYLGEILMWWGVAIACAVTLNKVYLITGAVVNTLMFFFVSIPMADKRQSRKEGFEEYKRQTRMLLPIKKFQIVKQV